MKYDIFINCGASKAFRTTPNRPQMSQTSPKPILHHIFGTNKVAGHFSLEHSLGPKSTIEP
eukprot:UN15630